MMDKCRGEEGEGDETQDTLFMKTITLYWKMKSLFYYTLFMKTIALYWKMKSLF